MENEKSQIDLRSYWAILGRRKALLILPLMIVPLVAFIITYFMKPTYVSTVSILIGDTMVLPTPVQQDVQGRNGGYDYRSAQELQSSYLNQITSTKYLKRLIAVLNIPISEEVKRMVALTKANYPDVTESDLAENILSDQLRKRVMVSMRSNNLIDLSVVSIDPISARKMAAALADIFIEENLASELAGIRSSISFSEDQLAFYKDKLKEAEDKLRDFRQGILSSSFGQDTSSINLREIASAVQTLDIEISNEQEQQAGLRSALDQESVDVSAFTLPPGVSTLRDRLLGNVNQLANLLTSYSWRDAKVVSLNEESRGLITDITTQIRTWAEQKYAASPANVRETIIEYLAGNIVTDFNHAKRASLDSYIGKTKTKLGEDPGTEITLQRLQSEVDSYKRFYDLFVSHSQNAAINQSAIKVEAEAKYTIIRPASLPLAPDSPNRFRIFGMGIALGLVLGFGAILTVELLDDSFKKIEDVTHYLKLPVIGTIPRMELPFGNSSKKRFPIIIGLGISMVLIMIIVFLHFKKNG